MEFNSNNITYHGSKSWYQNIYWLLEKNDLPNHNIFKEFENGSNSAWIDFKFDVHSYTKV